MSVENLRELMELAGKTDAGDTQVAASKGRGMPLDGSLYATNEYLQMLQNSDDIFYSHYVRHIQYFMGMYKFEGDPDIERMSPDILRQAIEFGSVGITEVKGRLAPIAIVTPEYNIYKELKSVKGITLRDGYGYTKKQKCFSRKGKDVALLKQNYQALPFIFFWEKPIQTIVKLEKAAVTGSIASIKKFKRNLQNNDSDIARIETQSMMNPDHPYVNNIVSPASYEQELEQAMAGDTPSEGKANSTAPNSIDFNSMESSAEGQWDNLKEYINYIYFQNGRRTNTNKKSDRNLEGEINVEVVNFDILDAEFRGYLDKFVKDLNKTFKRKIKLVSLVDDMQISKGTVDKEGREGKGKTIRSLFRKDKND